MHIRTFLITLSKERLTFLSIFLFLTGFSHASIFVQVDDSSPTNKSSVYIAEGQTIKLLSNASGSWMKYEPVLHEYDNLKNGAKSIEAIEYNIIPLEEHNFDSILILNNLKPGTYYFGKNLENDTSIITIKPIHLIDENIIQIVVRQSDTYIGFLTEQLNLPFIIPPKYIPNYGHQTDLNIGTDCAELAIYGMRRLGYDIPYVGPQGITKYLKPSDSLHSGTILHFGFQVSILYQDCGIIGQLDSNDLLIHAFEDKVKIETYGESNLWGMECRKYEWMR